MAEFWYRLVTPRKPTYMPVKGENITCTRDNMDVHTFVYTWAGHEVQAHLLWCGIHALLLICVLVVCVTTESDK